MRRVALIKGGTIVTANETYQADIAIQDGKIAAIGQNLDAPAASAIEARSCYVIPGGIDPHTHLDTFFGGTISADDYRTGTIAAAAGGTTCVVDFALQARGERLTDVAEGWIRKGAGKAVHDWGIHVMVGQMNEQAMADMGALVERGITSFKVFVAYKGAVTVGADADLVVWDPEVERTISAATHYQNVDYNLYEGFRVTGQARDVLVRGRTVFEQGGFRGEPGYGQFLRRNRITGRV